MKPATQFCSSALAGRNFGQRLMGCVVVLALAACSAKPGIPETRYHVLPDRAAATQRDLGDMPIVVAQFSADGPHSSLAMVHSPNASGAPLEAYHYELWAQAPPELLQQRLIRQLRAAGGDQLLVVERLRASQASIRVEGRVRHFERVAVGESFRVVVELALRADLAREGRPLVTRDYREVIDTPDPTLAASVEAFGEASDRISSAFARDLEQALASRGKD